jgi:hypothetical protein
MSHAWFNYLFPLSLFAAFVVAGVATFKGARSAGRRAARERAGGLLVAVIGFGLAIGFVFTAPMPWTRQRIIERILHTPPDQIESFVITSSGDDNKPLNRSTLVIEDRNRILRIARILADAREISPNHPRTRWAARVEMVTRGGRAYFWLSATEPGDVNGTMLTAVPTRRARGGISRSGTSGIGEWTGWRELSRMRPSTRMRGQVISNLDPAYQPADNERMNHCPMRAMRMR